MGCGEGFANDDGQDVRLTANKGGAGDCKEADDGGR